MYRTYGITFRHTNIWNVILKDGKLDKLTSMVFNEEVRLGVAYFFIMFVLNLTTIIEYLVCST